MLILGQLEVPTWIIITVISIISFYIYGIWPYRYWKKRGLKQPPMMPFLGDMHNFLKNVLSESMMAEIAKYGRVYGTYLLRQPVMVVANTDMLKQICVKHADNFTDRNTFQQPKPISESVLNLKGAAWKKMRSLLSPTFSSGKLKAMFPLIEESCVSFCNQLDKNAPEVDIKDLCTRFTLDVIASTLFGLKIDQDDPRNEFKEHSNKLFHIRGFNRIKFILLSMFPSLIGPIYKYFQIGIVDSDAINYFVYTIQTAIKERRKSENADKYKDFIASMLAAKDENDTLSEDDILAQSLIFFLAGFETTANVMQYVVYFMALNPSCQERVYEEIKRADKLNYETVMNLKYLNQCIDESMRMLPVAVMVDRKCTKPISIHGYDIEKDLVIRLPIYFLAHDPDVWDNPETFDPDRFDPDLSSSRDPLSFIPFGVGPRNCIGMRLAQLELRKALSEILLKFKFSPTETTPAFDKLEFKPGTGLIMMKKPIKLNVERRS